MDKKTGTPSKVIKGVPENYLSRIIIFPWSESSHQGELVS